MPNPARPTIETTLRDHVQSKVWPSNRALLLVHGVGNAKPGDYVELEAKVREALGPGAADFAIYQLFYDVINDWFAEKTQLAPKLEEVLGFLKGKLDPTTLSEAMVEVVGDVLWPVMSESASSTIIRS